MTKKHRTKLQNKVSSKEQKKGEYSISDALIQENAASAENNDAVSKEASNSTPISKGKKKLKKVSSKKQTKREYSISDVLIQENAASAENNDEVSKEASNSTPISKGKKKLKKVSSKKQTKGEYSISDVLESAASAENNDEVSKEASNSTPISKGKKKLKNGMISVQRSEASENISEFSLNEVGKERVKLNELIKASQKLSGQGPVKKQLDKAKKLKSLSVPLNKQQITKIKRSTAYNKVCDEVTRWEPTVHGNRAAQQIIYPLKKPEIRLETFENVSEKFVTKHPVAIAVDALLQKSENVLTKEKSMTEAEEKALKAMSLEEAKARHNELMKHRALISYQEAKARRQNKIKSKRYHRLLKKEKMKKLMKEFEELQDHDAAAAMEKILEADKLRVMERMTLKHRNTGKWAKMQKLRAKYNPEARSNLKEDIRIGRELREKVPDVQKKISELSADLSSQNMEENDISVYNDGLIESSSFKKSDDHVPFTGMVTGDLLLNSVSNDALEGSQPAPEQLEKSTAKFSKTSAKKSSTVKVTDFIGADFISEASALNSFAPNNVIIGDHLDEIEEGDDEDDEIPGAMTVSEAFADENVIAEFHEDKRAAEEANRPKRISTLLPGWNSWAGAGIKVSKGKRKRYKEPKVEPAPKKNTLGNVILNEDRDKKAAVHQVSHLPFPFSKPPQFESYIRQPIGHTWNTPSSFRNLVAPKVVTKAGKVIEPIDAEDVVLDESTKKPSQIVKKKRRKALEQQAF